MTATTGALFALGRVVMTAGVQDLFLAGGLIPDELTALLERHQRGDWGALDAHDRAVNAGALRRGERLLSAYPLPGAAEAGARDRALWIITEADRSATTILLPSEY